MWQIKDCLRIIMEFDIKVFNWNFSFYHIKLSSTPCRKQKLIPTINAYPNEISLFKINNKDNKTT